MSLKQLPSEVFTTKFYDYSIDYVVINGIKMYAISNILYQYNKVNKTEKILTYWLRLKETKELFKTLVEEYDKSHKTDDNSPPDYSQGRVKDDFNSENKEPLKSQKFILSNNNIFIPGIIQKIYFGTRNFGANWVYVVNAVLLHDILCWLDRSFAYKLYSYLETIREQDNDKLTTEINSQKIIIDELQLKSDNLHKINSEQQQKITELTDTNSKLTKENEALVKENKFYEFCDKNSSAVITDLKKDINTLKEVNDNVSKINISLVFKNTKLNNMLNESNTRLKELETNLNSTVQHKTKEIKKQINDRLVHDSKPNQWFVKACKTRTRNTITIKTSYCHLSPSPKDIRTSVYCCKNLPNGLVFRREAATELKDLVEKFGGRQKNISTFVIPVQYINISDEDLDQRIRAAMKATRKRLGWRHDLN